MTEYLPPRISMQIAFTTDPLTRPGALDWTDVASEDVDVKSLTSTRGARIRTGEIVPGTATAAVEYKDRVLEPDVVGTPWYPNVDLRKRVRYVLSWDGPGGPVEEVLWTGFINGLPTTWSKRLAQSTVSASGILSLINNIEMPPSVLEHTIRELGPTAYWPLGETAGQFADDVIGTKDGTYAQQIQPVTPGIVDWDPRGSQLFYPRTTVLPAQYVVADLSVTSSDWISMAAWVRFGNNPGSFGPAIFALQDTATPVNVGTTNGLYFAVLNNAADLGWVALAISNGGAPQVIQAVAAGPTLVGPNIGDNDTHLVQFNLRTTTGAIEFLIDGVLVPGSYAFSGSVTAITSTLQHALMGWGFTIANPAGSVYDGALSHVAYFDRKVTTAEHLEIYEAGMNPWDGDTTGERIDRILDIAGVDPDDRDIATGTKVCGPAILGGTVGTYLQKAVATEGAPFFESGEGLITFADAVDNVPSVDFVLSDNPTVDGGAPYEPVNIDYSVARLINHAAVTRPGGDVQRSEDAASKLAYGAKPVQFETLHGTPNEARVAGGSLVLRHATPRRSFDAVTVSSRHVAEVPASISIQSEIGNVAQFVARPDDDAASSDPLDVLTVVESIGHTISSRSWRTTFGTFQHKTIDEWVIGVNGHSSYFDPRGGSALGSVTFNAPAGRQVGDLLVVHLGHAGGTSVAITGWTQRSWSTNGSWNMLVYTRVADGTAADNFTGTFGSWSDYNVGFYALATPLATIAGIGELFGAGWSSGTVATTAAGLSSAGLGLELLVGLYDATNGPTLAADPTFTLLSSGTATAGGSTGRQSMWVRPVVDAGALGASNVTGGFTSGGGHVFATKLALSN